MNTASKKSLFFVLLTSLASLTACGGGSGGRGRRRAPDSAPDPISVSEITGGMPQQGYLAEDYSNAGDSGGLKATLENGGLTGNVEGHQVTIVHGNSIDVVAEYGEPNARVLKESNLPSFRNTAREDRNWSSG